jgi:hypothetical protein
MSLDAIKRQTVDRRARNINIVGPATSINQINLTKLNNMDMENLKLCMNCKWFQPDEHQPMCGHDDAKCGYIDPVMGNHRIWRMECRDMRQVGRECGHDAKLWEEKM